MNTKTQKWSGLNGCGVNVQYDNRFIVNHLQSLHIILIEYAIIVESMLTDLKSFSVLQKYVCFVLCLCAFPCISAPFILHLLLNLITCLNNKLLLSVCLPNRVLIVKMCTSVGVFVFSVVENKPDNTQIKFSELFPVLIEWVSWCISSPLKIKWNLNEKLVD